MNKPIQPSAFGRPRFVLSQQMVMLSIALTLMLFGWHTSARAQSAAQLSSVAAILSDCQDLMHQIRQRYGRAPVCLEVKAGGQSITELNGLVGLADDTTNPWYEMRFTPEAGDPTLYHYAQSDLNNVIALIQDSNRGLTLNQTSQMLASNACGQVESRFKAMREAGTLTKQQYQYALSDFHKTAKGCAK